MNALIIVLVIIALVSLPFSLMWRMRRFERMAQCDDCIERHDCAYYMPRLRRYAMGWNSVYDLFMKVPEKDCPDRKVEKVNKSKNTGSGR